MKVPHVVDQTDHMISQARERDILTTLPVRTNLMPIAQVLGRATLLARPLPAPRAPGSLFGMP